MTLCDLLTAIVAVTPLASGTLAGAQRGIAEAALGGVIGLGLSIGSLAGVLAWRSVILRRVDAVISAVWQEIVVSLFYCSLLVFSFLWAWLTVSLTRAVLSDLFG